MVFMFKKSKLFVVPHGCPLCGSDVVGNEEVGYYCKHCNLLFEFKDLSRAALEKLAKGEKSIIKEYDKKDKYDKQEDTKNNNKENNNSKEKTNSTNSKGAKYFVASKLSNKFHIPQCPFAKNINKKNLVVFKSEAEAVKAGFKACKCVK